MDGILASPLGPIGLREGARGLREASFGAPGGPAASTPAARELAEYFAGRRRAFSIPVDPEGTPFQRRVWDALAAIPFGATTTYARIARKVASVPRAVGTAVGANPVAIVVPCHRVVGGDGSLTGYAGGLDRKAWLLAHEARIVATEDGILASDAR